MDMIGCHTYSAANVILSEDLLQKICTHIQGSCFLNFSDIIVFII